jgi:hypothetical protein
MLGEFQSRSFENNFLLCNMLYLYYKINRKTRLMRLYCVTKHRGNVGRMLKERVKQSSTTLLLHASWVFS